VRQVSKSNRLEKIVLSDIDAGAIGIAKVAPSECHSTIARVLCGIYFAIFAVKCSSTGSGIVVHLRLGREAVLFRGEANGGSEWGSNPPATG
jgi:hypothetical protein